MRGIVARLKKVLAREGVAGLVRSLSFHLGAAYARIVRRKWIGLSTPTSSRLANMREESRGFGYQPLFSVVLPVFNTKPRFLREALGSVLEQAYPFWELCVADDASTDPQIVRILKSYAQKDSRIKVVMRPENGHISAASNSALDLATGEFVALLDHDDVLAPHALYEVALALNQDTNLDMIYSDEDKIDQCSWRMEPAFKGAWSPEYFFSFMYIGHLLVLRRELVERVGRFRIGFEGSQDYDLALRVTALSRKVAHLPQILYHWRSHAGSVAGDLGAKPYAFEAAKKALREALEQAGLKQPEVNDTWVPGVYRTTEALSRPPKVSVLVYFFEEGDLENRLSTLREKTEYRSINFVAGLVSEKHKEGGGVYRSLWHFIRSAAASDGAEFCVLLDGRALPREPTWVEQLMQYAVRPGVGLVGAKISDRFGRCWHAGYTQMGRRVSHNGFKAGRFERGYGMRLVAAHNVSAVSSMGLAVSRGRLLGEALGRLPLCSRLGLEVALAFEVREQGQRVVINPHVDLLWEGKPLRRVQDLSDHPEDLAQLEKVWGVSDFVDPYYPCGLDGEAMNFRMKP